MYGQGNVDMGDAMLVGMGYGNGLTGWVGM